MNTKQIGDIAIVINRLMAITQNLESGNFKIVICDDGAERDVTKDNIKTIAALKNRLQAVLDEHNKKYTGC